MLVVIDPVAWDKPHLAGSKHRNMQWDTRNERPHSEHSFVPTEASLNVVSQLGCMSRSTEWFDWQHV